MARKVLQCCVVALALFAYAVAAAQQIEDHEVELQNAPNCDAATIRAAIIASLAGRNNLSRFRAILAGDGTAANPPADIGANPAPAGTKWTVFAPVNSAIDAINGIASDAAASTLAQATRDTIARRHITNSGHFPAKALRNGQTLNNLIQPTAETLAVSVVKNGGTRTITITGRTAARAGVVDAIDRNIKACKTIIHAISNQLD